MTYNGAALTTWTAANDRTRAAYELTKRQAARESCWRCNRPRRDDDIGCNWHLGRYARAT